MAAVGLAGTAVPAHRRVPGDGDRDARAQFRPCARSGVHAPTSPTWSFGVTVSYPLDSSYEEAGLARAENRTPAGGTADREPSATTAGDGPASSPPGAKHGGARRRRTLGREAGAGTVDAEQRRFEVGLSTTFLVTQAQRDLLQAQVNLLQTMLDYESSLREPGSGAAGAAASQPAIRSACEAPASCCSRPRRRGASSVPAREPDCTIADGAQASGALSISLVQRIREEFEGAQGLRVTVREASQFWALDKADM